MGAHVLVADDDPHVVRMLREVLVKRGYTIDIASDGEEAYARAVARPPDVLVTDVMMPKVDGWTLVRTLREHPKLGKLPVIFLTALGSEDERVRAFRLGADDYIGKPFKFEDLVGRIEKAVKKRPTKTTIPNKLANSGLAGDLAQVGLSTLLVLVEMERKTGLLKLRGPNDRPGEILVREGKVIDARLMQGPPSGAECVYTMLTWTTGKFEFNARAVDGPDKIGVPTTHLLMEGARLIDESNEPAADAPVATIPPVRDSSPTDDGWETD
jgi:CheY-like chemotaxis protein